MQLLQMPPLSWTNLLFIEQEQGTRSVEARGVGVHAIARGGMPKRHGVNCPTRHREMMIEYRAKKPCVLSYCSPKN